ncbi:MAG TPA: CAP domain-containing protein [Acidimicrobiales bacterium]|nr:CAP domain-containing protein [Acidimicrobiales bacterium]
MSFSVRPPVRRRFLAPLVIAAALVGSLFALSAPGTAVTNDEAALASLVNGARAAAGLPALAVSGGLSDVARSHSASMAAAGDIYHSGALGSTVGTAVPNWTSVGENVGVGATVAEVHAALMASGSHRANILGDYNVLGVGVVRSADGRLWVTELFAKTATVVVEPAPTLVPEPVLAPVDTTVVTPAAVAPAPTPKARPAKVRAAARPAPRRAAAVRPAAGDCLPEQARGQGHAYGRCDDVPRGAGSANANAKGRR